MYNIINYIAFFLAVITVAVADEATTSALVTITNPKINQMLTPSQQLILQYTINGVSLSKWERNMTIRIQGIHTMYQIEPVAPILLQTTRPLSTFISNGHRATRTSNLKLLVDWSPM